MRLIKTLAISLILAAALAASLELFASVECRRADILAARYLWDEAAGHYEAALKIDGFSGDIMAANGKYLLLRNRSLKYKGRENIEKAVAFYEKAAALDPRNADHGIMLGQAYIAMGVLESEAGRNGKIMKTCVDKAFGCFRQAYANDQTGFAVSSAIGYAGLKYRGYLDASDLSFVSQRLRACLLYYPIMSEKVFSKIWALTRDSGYILSLIPDGLKEWYDINAVWHMLDALYVGDKPRAGKNTVNREEWFGRELTGKYRYKSGWMYWSGGMSALVDPGEGKKRIIIKASGKPCNGVPPYITIWLNGRKIDGIFIADARVREYSFSADVAKGTNILTVYFANDCGFPNGDRDVYIDMIRMIPEL